MSLIVVRFAGGSWRRRERESTLAVTASADFHWPCAPNVDSLGMVVLPMIALIAYWMLSAIAFAVGFWLSDLWQEGRR